MATATDVEIAEGDRLRAEATGKTYRVTKVTTNWVYVTGLPRVPRHELVEDIAAGKVTKLNDSGRERQHEWARDWQEARKENNDEDR